MVHCAAGMGRTGTVLACYLVKYQKYSAKDAIEKVRTERPGSIQSEVQELAIQIKFFHFYPPCHSGIEMVSILPSTALINMNLLSLKIIVMPSSLSGSSISRTGCPNRPSYFAMNNF
jgi:hypothetical protein